MRCSGKKREGKGAEKGGREAGGRIFTDGHETDCVVDVVRSDEEGDNGEARGDITTDADADEDGVAVYRRDWCVDVNGVCMVMLSLLDLPKQGKGGIYIEVRSR